MDTKIKKSNYFISIISRIITRMGILFSDIFFIKLVYRLQTGHRLNLKNPISFNEKIQWLKLYDRRPEYTLMVDKYAVKEYVAGLIGNEYIIPTIGIWNRFDEINFKNLPNKFVLKTTHDSGGVIICKDKSLFDIKSAKVLITKCLNRNYFFMTREWPYKNVVPRIIAEEYIVDESGLELKDYKIFTFNGKAHLIQVDFDRFIHHKRNLYTTDWRFINAQIHYPNDPNREITRPVTLDKMIGLAEKLASGIPHLRTDFYTVGDKIFFGELTFSHGSGHEYFIPESLNIELGNLISIDKLVNINKCKK